MRKTTRKKIAPIVITVLVIAYIAPLMAIVLGTMGLWSGGESVNVMFPLLCWLIVGAGGRRYWESSCLACSSWPVGRPSPRCALSPACPGGQPCYSRC